MLHNILALNNLMLHNLIGRFKAFVEESGHFGEFSNSEKCLIILLPDCSELIFYTVSNNYQ